MSHIDLIKQARELNAQLGHLWEAVGFDEFTQELHDSPYDEEESFDGAGIFTRRGNVIWRQQYGGVDKAVLDTDDAAHELMDYIRESKD